MASDGALKVAVGVGEMGLRKPGSGLIWGGSPLAILPTKPTWGMATKAVRLLDMFANEQSDEGELAEMKLVSPIQRDNPPHSDSNLARVGKKEARRLSRRKGQKKVQIWEWRLEELRWDGGAQVESRKEHPEVGGVRRKRGGNLPTRREGATKNREWKKLR